MRIAVSGAHAVGKSTLVADLAAQFLPMRFWKNLITICSPEGVPFADTPTTENLELQLERSLELIATHSGSNVRIEHAGLRKRVNQALQRILLEDELGLGLPALEVAGSPDERVHQVLDYIAAVGQIDRTV